MKKKDQKSGAPTTGTRNYAEWVSFAISVAILFTLAGYLGSRALEQEKHFFSVEIKPLVDKVQERDGRFILPLKVEHPEGRTFAKLVVELKIESAQGVVTKREMEFDYLAEKGNQVVYVYLEESPQSAKVTATPLYYTLE
ncbi:MAG: hypothetical protein EOP09_03020 [Proteobacteria bacterium]|nr:MAG: hypothetical protein EOP09_03020 [Pseudomonadota bacterium]